MATTYQNLTMEDLLLEDMMLDILCRLSIKEIIYCKSVCKKWRNLISNPCFAYLHLYLCRSKSRFLQNFIIHDYTYSCRTPGLLKWSDLILVSEKNNTQSIDDCTLVFDPVRTLNLHKAACRKSFPLSKIQVAGSVDGLICVWSRSGTTYVFNPTLSNDYISLPPHHDQGYPFYMFPMLSEYVMFGCGFGVSSTREYKVVSICRNITMKQPIEILVFTLGTNLWRRITTNLPDDVVLSGHRTSGLYFNFHLHWIVNDSRIFAFELGTETFNLFSSPPIPTCEGHNSILGVINGCLSFCCWFRVGFTVWVMKEHGINHSWYEFATINHKVPYPLCLANGILMFLFGDTLKAYCLETNAFKPVKITPRILVGIITYHPSFLNLNNFVSDTVVVRAF